MGQPMDIFIELTATPYNLIGSLDRVDAFAQESLTDFVESRMRTMGPFSSWEEYHKSSLQFILHLILRGELYSQQAADACLIHRFLIDLIPFVLPHTIQFDEMYYLEHANDKRDLLVDDNFNITGIID
ncbi:hypothetical protein CHU98_g7237 [Xylaria longipes]|nr:hypothetical protein CHU98_g7237 [Xylaria longipes]